MEKQIVMIQLGGTSAEIAEGLRKFMADHQPPKTNLPDFEADRLTVGKAAEFSGRSYKTMCDWITQGKVPVHGSGRTRFVLRSELIDSLKNMK